MKRWKSFLATGALVLAVTGGAFAESRDPDDRRDRDNRAYYAQRYDHDRDDRAWSAHRDRDDHRFWDRRDRDDRDHEQDHRRVDRDDYYGRR
jgi:hypothetical protein